MKRGRTEKKADKGSGRGESTIITAAMNLELLLIFVAASAEKKD